MIVVSQHRLLISPRLPLLVDGMFLAHFSKVLTTDCMIFCGTKGDVKGNLDNCKNNSTSLALQPYIADIAVFSDFFLLIFAEFFPVMKGSVPFNFLYLYTDHYWVMQSTLAQYDNLLHSRSIRLTQLIVSKDTVFIYCARYMVHYTSMGEKWKLDNPLSRSLNGGTRISEVSKSS